MRRSRLAGPQRARVEKSWHYEDEFCRPFCKRNGVGAMVTPNISQVNCKGCLRAMKEKGIIQDDESTNTVG